MKQIGMGSGHKKKMQKRSMRRTGPLGELMKTKEGVHPRIVALGLPSPPPWAQKPLQNKRRRGRGVGGEGAEGSQAAPPPPTPPPPPPWHCTPPLPQGQGTAGAQPLPQL